MLFIIGIGMQSKKSVDTWSNTQVWPGVQNETRQKLTVFSREHTGCSKHALPSADAQY